jgi:Arc/MetJ-type ribon-helix-helix transcriptional regulator
MNKKITIEISESALLRAEKRAQEEGFESLAAYIDALIRDDLDVNLDQDWIRERIAEGLASGSAGPLSEEKIYRLVSEGIARANSKA